MDRYINKINHSILNNCSFDPWLQEDNDFLDQIHFLKNVDIKDQEEVHDTIKALEILKVKLKSWLNDYNTLLDEDDIDYFISLYEKHLIKLKNYEGCYFEKALSSLNMCLRIVQFLMSDLYDFPDPIFGKFTLPKEIKDLV